MTTDWRINFDFHNNPTIPSEAEPSTILRPDIVIFSLAKKVIIWFEQTVPLERNMLHAHCRKVERYEKLVSNIKLNGWTVHPFTIEIGALGFLGKRFNAMLSLLGMKPTQKKICP